VSWIPTLALFVVTVPLVLLLLAGFVPSLLRGGRQGNGAGLMIAALVAIGIGVVVGVGVVAAYVFLSAVVSTATDIALLT
jgi:hypothetical protein